MQKGLTVAGMWARQREHDEHKTDMTIPAARLMLGDPRGYSGLGTRFHLLDSRDTLGELSHPFTPWSLSQFCSKHGLDRKRWLEVEEYGGHSVRATYKDHVNACLKSGFGYDLGNSERLVRLYTATKATGTQSHVRAVLSSKYSRVANQEILQRTGEAMDELDQKGVDFRVIQASHDIDRLIVRIVSKTRDEGGLKIGVQIKNAEDGSMKIEVEPFTFDSFCENGLVFGVTQKEGGMSRRHIGSTEILLKQRFNLALAEAFHLSEEMTIKFLGLRDRNVEDPLDQIVALCAKHKSKMQTNDSFVKEAQGALPLYQTHYGNNMYSVVSAITQAAQNLEDLDRVRIERVMGGVVSELKTV